MLPIRGYQKFISPGLPPSCRFSPSCSQYALEAVSKSRRPARGCGSAPGASSAVTRSIPVGMTRFPDPVT